MTLTPTNSGHRKMVHAPRFPKPKLGGWWLILGVDDELLALKRVHVGRGPTRASLAFVAPDDGGDHEYELHLVSDSYVGLDQMQPVRKPCASPRRATSDAGNCTVRTRYFCPTLKP